MSKAATRAATYRYIRYTVDHQQVKKRLPSPLGASARQVELRPALAKNRARGSAFSRSNVNGNGGKNFENLNKNAKFRG